MPENEGRLGATDLSNETIQIPAIRFTYRGEEVTWPMIQEPVVVWRTQIESMYWALLALEDPRVDGVLEAFGLVMRGHDGEQIFPRPE